MPMSVRDRILTVFRGETPDVVPFMMDLEHWFCHRTDRPFDISQSLREPDYELLDYHREAGVGFFSPSLVSFFSVEYGQDAVVRHEKADVDGVPTITWTCETPLGVIKRSRAWQKDSYSWGIREWGVKTKQDLKVLAYVMSHRTFVPRWDIYRAWSDYVADQGVVYLPLGYSAIGMLLNTWMGIEATVYALHDWPVLMREIIDSINANVLDCVDMIADSPAPVIRMGDNFSGDVQHPRFFGQWSRAFYVEAIRRLHAAGKYVAVHIDGRVKGALGMIEDCGADCADAVTPVPMGNLTPKQCRAEAGPDLILSGGISPDLFRPEASTEDLRRFVLQWLELRKDNPRLIAAVGDELAPGTPEDRIGMIRDLVETYGRY